MIIFRADGNSIIGSGHIMRCLSIAMAAKELGQECCFVLADNSFETIIREYGFECEILHSEYSNMDDERGRLLAILQSKSPTHIIVDSYYVTERYLEWLSNYAQLMYIDDRAEFAYPVDILINYNIFADKRAYLDIYKKADRKIPRLLLGTEYIPLRKEFQGLTRRRQAEVISKILVSSGGADSEHVMLNMIKYLQDKTTVTDKFEFHFILGAMNKDIDEINKMAKNMPRVVLYQNVKSMQTLMSQCDVAIAAAGSTLYELCACGVPTITYVLADNQIPAEKAFVEKNIMLSVGDYREINDFQERLFTLLDKLDNDYLLRVQMISNAYKVVNGYGATKLIEKILEDKI